MPGKVFSSRVNTSLWYEWITFSCLYCLITAQVLHVDLTSSLWRPCAITMWSQHKYCMLIWHLHSGDFVPLPCDHSTSTACWSDLFNMVTLCHNHVIRAQVLHVDVTSSLWWPCAITMWSQHKHWMLIWSLQSGDLVPLPCDHNTITACWSDLFNLVTLCHYHVIIVLHVDLTPCGPSPNLW